MDFSELFQKAEKNARRQERKVREFDEELEKKRRLQNERIAVERARAKLELKRKIPPPPPAASLPTKSKKETPQVDISIILNLKSFKIVEFCYSKEENRNSGTKC